MDSEHGGIWADASELKRKFWRNDVAERREALFPFLWSTIAKQGQIFGNQTKGSVARVTNGMAFSYPGYNEMLTGHPDPKIDRNEFGPNPNVTVFEWLNRMPEFRGKVAVFATWNVFQDIFNEKRSGLVLQTGWNLPEKGKLTPRQELINELYRTTTPLDDEDTYNSFIQIPLLDYVKSDHPRVLFVGYGETDNWAHQGRYDLVLQSAHGFDHFVAAALGNHAGDAGISRPDYFHPHHRSRTRQRAGGMERARRGRKGIGEYLDCGHGPGYSGARRTRKCQNRSRSRRSPRRWQPYWARTIRTTCPPPPSRCRICGE